MDKGEDYSFHLTALTKSVLMVKLRFIAGQALLKDLKPLQNQGTIRETSVVNWATYCDTFLGNTKTLSFTMTF